jgi:adenosylcobinamide kinase/adenosylcobinamide-phosphate guanylyltransferase
VKILLTGGSANGKSSFAETLALTLPAPRYYLAAMRPYGDGAAAKIARHRAMRAGKGFISLERYTDVGGTPVERGSTVLLECMCNLTANEMFRDGSVPDESAYRRVLDGVTRLSSVAGNLIVVTNDVGSDGGGYDAATTKYADTLGQLNAALAAEFDAVYELVCGIPLKIKGDLP